MVNKNTAKYAAYPLERVSGVLPKLKEADIILVHIKRSFLRHYIRKVTDSYWDHAALVLYTKNPKKGRLYDQIIEAVEPRGVEIHKLEKYLKNPDKYDVGIKRFKRMDTSTRHKAVNYMLMNIDAPYYRLSRVKFFLASLSKYLSSLFIKKQRYCCSSFVQKAFYEAAEPKDRGKYIFKKDLLSPIELNELLTPADIARDKHSAWIYNEK